MPRVTDAPQSSPASARLPAFLLALILLANSAASQEQATTIQAGSFQRSPSGVQLGSILAGAPVVADSTAGNWRHIVLQGWIFTASTRADRREGFDVSVRVAPTENLRIEPNGTVIARLAEGALLRRVRTRGGWTLVQREGWIPSRTLPEDRTVPVAATTDYVPDTSRVEVSTPTTAIMQQPEGSAVGTLEEGTPAQVLARSGEWARIRVEGWVHQDSLRPVAGGALVGVTAAEVRANPERYVGREVDWKLQFVAIQTADELRPEIPVGQRYLLTRGPAPEAGFVYVVIDQADLGRFRSLQPLQDLTMRVRILAARTKYLPNPVVQMLVILESAP